MAKANRSASETVDAIQAKLTKARGICNLVQLVAAGDVAGTTPIADAIHAATDLIEEAHAELDALRDREPSRRRQEGASDHPATAPGALQ